MDQSLTVVLPVHNGERQLRSSVQDILDLAPTSQRPLQIVIVDDGSTDDTYDTACELMRMYPQLTVLRQSVRQGLGAALELVRNRLAVEMVLVHDGVSTIDTLQLQTMLQTAGAGTAVVERAVSPTTPNTESTGSRRFSAVRALHDRMEQAHRKAACFRWIQLDKPLVPRRRSSAPSTKTPQPIGLPIKVSALPMGTTPTPQT